MSARCLLFFLTSFFIIPCYAQGLPIPLGKTPPPPPELKNLPPFVSVFDPKPTPPVTKTESPAPAVASTAILPKEFAPTPSAPEPVAPTPPPLSPEERNARMALLRQILPVAAVEAAKYNKLFRDLSAEETRRSERFNYDGEVEHKRTVVCELVVYQSRLDEKMGYEYRSAKSIDGKALKVDNKRIEKFFQRLLKASSVQKELDLINEEGFQHDLPLGSSFYGLTLYQWREIEAWALADVGYEVLGRDKVEGVDTVVLYYRQLNPNKRLEWELPAGFGHAKVEQTVHGRLWLDLKTMQIRQGEREMVVKIPSAPAPIRLWRQTMLYQPSAYGIWVPRRIVSDFYFYFKRQKDGVVTATQSGRLTSEYGEFKRFDVTSEEQEKKTIIKESAPTKPH